MTKRQEIRSEDLLRGLSRYTCDVHVLRFPEAEPGSLRNVPKFPQESSAPSSAGCLNCGLGN